MELRHLRYFKAVFEARSISRAAELLLISQPALTRQIHLLEHELGTPLFDRVSVGVRPTAAATALHSHALTMLRLADATLEVARSAGPVGEQVEIGLPPGVPPRWLRATLNRLRTEVPEAVLTFADVGSVDQLRMVRAGQLDIALVHHVPPDPLVQQPLFEQSFGVAVRPGHPLAGRAHCPLVDLADVRVLAHSRDQVPTEHDRMIELTSRVGRPPRWRYARFVENALICADAADADAVLLTGPSAARLLPDWPWSELVAPEVTLRTWAACQQRPRAIVTAALDSIIRSAPSPVWSQTD
ncbi:MAG TPA: LysR family transcriptional regulator [Pseudonocardia sp.]|jgi:DNA-binding transcriptional LysR family regulator|nr:LysR family transcriptional regulator [Pseudonocardia sp.]